MSKDRPDRKSGRGSQHVEPGYSTMGDVIKTIPAPAQATQSTSGAAEKEIEKDAESWGDSDSDILGLNEMKSVL